MSLSEYVRILGRGQGRARSFTQAEAREAMHRMLADDAAPEAVGAILMLLRMKGETAEEIAGLTQGARDSLPAWPGRRPALDWPSYAAGRSRGAPWFLLSARLVAMAGVPVLLHGRNGAAEGAASVRDALAPLGIASAADLSEAAQRIERDGIVYLPLEGLSPPLLRLLRLREVLGLRSCVNTVLRMLNPAGAPAAVQGVFHPAYREIQRDAAALMGLGNLTVLKGGGGEFEHHAAKDIALFGLRDGRPWDGGTGRATEDHRRLATAEGTPADLWAGRVADPFAESVVISTAQLALDTAGVAADARTLWNDRPVLHPV